MNNGIDVSHNQNPNFFNWEKFLHVKQFLIARSTYGTRVDRCFHDYHKKCNELGIKFGAYHFFRQQQSADMQIELIQKTLADVNYGSGNIFPALDLEWNERYDGKVVPDWHNERGRKIAEWMRNVFGGCLIYISPSFWATLGYPEWVLEHYIWIAHWDVPVPDLLGKSETKPESIWQYDVANTDFYNDPNTPGGEPIDLDVTDDLSSIIIKYSDNKPLQSINELKKKLDLVEKISDDILDKSGSLCDAIEKMKDELNSMMELYEERRDDAIEAWKNSQ